MSPDARALADGAATVQSVVDIRGVEKESPGRPLTSGKFSGLEVSQAISCSVCHDSSHGLTQPSQS